MRDLEALIAAEARAILARGKSASVHRLWWRLRYRGAPKYQTIRRAVDRMKAGGTMPGCETGTAAGVETEVVCG